MSKDKETIATYPDPNRPNVDKATKEYILPYLKTAYHDYMNNQYYGYSNRDRKIRNKRYRLSEEDTSIYKDRMNVTGDSSYMNLDYSPVSVIPGFVDVIVNSILDDKYKITVSARDAMTLEARDEKRNKLMGDMYSIGLSQKVSKMMGKDFTTKDAPTSEEEVDLKMDADYKDDMEISFEQGVREIRRMNNAKEIDRYVLDDLVTCGEGVERVLLLPNGEIKHEYIDAINFIRSFSHTPDNKTLKHAGHVTKMTLAELRKRVGQDDNFTEEDWEEISQRVSNRKSGYKAGTAIYVNNAGNSSSWDDSVDVDVVEIEFVDFNYNEYEYKETQYGFDSIHERAEGYTLPENSSSKREIVKDSYQVVYKGSWIVGTDYIFDYGKAHNISINADDFYTANLSYIVYTMYGKSMVHKIITYAEQIQMQHLKLQQLSSKARPAGLAIDVSALENAVANGNGAFFSPLELAEMYDQTGNLYYRSDNEDPEMRKTGPPITETTSNIKESLEGILIVYNHYARQIREISGINDFMDGTNRNKDALVGIQDQAIKSGKNATGSIDSAFYNVIERSAERTIEFLQDVMGDENAEEKYKQILGTETVEIIERIKDTPINMMAIDVEFEPTEAEKEVLNRHIEVALSGQLIELEDSLLIREVDNVGLGIRMLKQKKRKKAEDMAKAIAAQDQKAQEAAQAQQKAEMDKIAAESKIKAEAEVFVHSEKAKIDLVLKQQLNALEMDKLKTEILGKIDVAKISSQSGMSKQTMAEDRKDARDKDGRSMDSRLIEQRKDRLPEQDFRATPEDQMKKTPTNPLQDQQKPN